MTESTLGEAGTKNQKSTPARQPTQPPKCPECTSQRVWKDGLRSTKNGDVQRWLCRSCGYRFSLNTISKSKEKVNVAFQNLSETSNPMLNSTDVQSVNFLSRKKRFDDPSFMLSENVRAHGSKPQPFSTAGKLLNITVPKDRERRVCVNEKKMKNLAKQVPQQEKAAGATLPEQKGKVIEYAWWLKKEGYRPSTIQVRTRYLRYLIRLGANILQPNNVKETVARQDWSETFKATVMSTYKSFATMQNIKVEKTKYRKEHKLPFIPTEREIDQLIAGCGKKTATFLQTLKETGMRCGEAWQLNWIDVDGEHNTVTVNNPEKHGNPRMIKVSTKLIAMLKALPKAHEKVFGSATLGSRRNCFTIQRRRVAQKLKNPRILKITFHTLRHWKATMEYHKTKDILHVKQLLGHRSINSTMLYTQLITFERDDFTCRIARTEKEITDLIEAGFEYTCDLNEAKFFRKPK